MKSFKFYFIYLIIFNFLFFSIPTHPSFAAYGQKGVGPKVRVLGTLSLYGIASGALLGTAAMAFGSPARGIAIGASLGLYSGLLFGGYIVATHNAKQFRPAPQTERYNESNSVYENTVEDNFPGSSLYDTMARKFENGFEYPADFFPSHNAKKAQSPQFFLHLLEVDF